MAIREIESVTDQWLIFPASFIFQLFPECFQTGKQEIKRDGICPDLIKVEKSVSLRIMIYSLVH